MSNAEEVDDPTAGKFASWRSYSRFAKHVAQQNRYVWTTEVRAFLDTVLATATERVVTIPKGRAFYRAQIGVDLWEDKEALTEELMAYGIVRMVPLPNKAREGRANPSGIPVLYVATSIDTAVSEVRPWIGSQISVATFITQRDLTLVDLSKLFGKSGINYVPIDHFMNGTPVNEATVMKAVWADIDNAFSKPVVTTDDEASYAPTQILTELFKNAGFDGIIYRSNFGEGFNLALFDVTSAVPVSGRPYEVSDITVSVKQIGNDWYKK